MQRRPSRVSTKKRERIRDLFFVITLLFFGPDRASHFQRLLYWGTRFRTTPNRLSCFSPTRARFISAALVFPGRTTSIVRLVKEPRRLESAASSSGDESNRIKL